LWTGAKEDKILFKKYVVASGQLMRQRTLGGGLSMGWDLSCGAHLRRTLANGTGAINNRSRMFWHDARGAAAAEFALILTLLAIPLLSAIDFGIYIYQGMEFSEAMQVAAQAAWTTCSKGTLPATVNCGGILTVNVGLAAHSTSLGTGVSVGTITEGYYCVKSSDGSLYLVASPPTARPSDCSGVPAGSATTTPGDYLLIPATFTYSPLFPGISIVSVLGTSMSKTAYIRLG
jgi:Flp pilus assembly pilin Flp